MTLDDLDRDVHAQRTLVTAQAADEPDEHILLRFLAWTLCFDPQLQDGHGWTDQNQPDLIGHDLTGSLTHWIECGPPPIKRVGKALGKSKTLEIMGFFADEGEALAFRKAVLAENPQRARQVAIWVIPRDFMAWLERIGGRNMDWQATISDGTLYLDCGGEQGECVAERLAMA